jgi:uncharacterized protein (UPF0335 family)
MNSTDLTPRERLVHHVQELERLEEMKAMAAASLQSGFTDAEADGYDKSTLKAVLKLRKMTPSQRKERRALEAVYLAALGMLEGNALPDEARERLDDRPKQTEQTERPRDQTSSTDTPPPTPEQPPLILKDPEEAGREGEAAAAEGKRVYDNPYPAGDPCRAAWDEGWCRQQKSHGMETPAAYRRRSEKPSKKDDDKWHGAGADDVQRGAA